MNTITNQTTRSVISRILARKKSGIDCKASRWIELSPVALKWACGSGNGLPVGPDHRGQRPGPVPLPVV